MAVERNAPISAILTADFGSVNTRVILFDQVAGQFRLISRAEALTTDAPPIGDVTVGLLRAVDQLAEQTGRALTTGGKLNIGDKMGTGVDLFVATASGGRPLTAVLVGLMPDVSLASGRRALGSIYIDLVDTLSLGDVRTQEQQVNAILNSHPDLIFIVGGTDNGAHDSMLALLETVKLAASLQPGTRPVVLYAGNEALQSQVKDLLGEETQVFTAPNVRPALNEERLGGAQLELAMVYGAYKASSTGGFSEVRFMSRLGVLPTANSYSTVMRYLGELANAGAGVLCVDVGSSTVTICATIRRQPFVSIRPDLGLGHSAVSAVDQIGAKNVARWLTYAASEVEVLDYAWNKTLHPATVPQSAAELEMEYALTRELIRSALDTAREAWGRSERGGYLPALRPIIGAGAALSQVVDPGVSALLLLDALQPVGVTELKLDPYGVIAALGGIAYLEPRALVQVLEAGGLLDLGTAICPTGHATGANAMTVTVKYESGRTVQRTIARDSLRTIELPSGQKATVTVKLERGLSLNGRRNRNQTFTVEGGAAGIVFDGRGRPLIVPDDLANRKETIPRWLESVRAERTAATNAPLSKGVPVMVEAASPVPMETAPGVRRSSAAARPADKPSTRK